MRGIVSPEGITKRQTPEAQKTPSDPEVAEYIADLTESLAKTARENGLPVLAHLLEMAREEAATAATGMQSAAENSSGD